MPGWHPLIVHFPIALLTFSLIVDLAALLAKRPAWHPVAYALLVAGTVAATAAVISGNAAAAPPPSPPKPSFQTGVARHA